MIVVHWADVATLEPGDIVASSPARRYVEHSRVLANLARKLENGQRPGVVVSRTTSPTVGDTDLVMACGRATLRRGYRAGSEVAVVSTSETPIDTLERLRETSNIHAATTGQEA